jgi:hypothetical protein
VVLEPKRVCLANALLVLVFLGVVSVCVSLLAKLCLEGNVILGAYCLRCGFICFGRCCTVGCVGVLVPPL